MINKSILAITLSSLFLAGCLVDEAKEEAEKISSVSSSSVLEQSSSSQVDLSSSGECQTISAFVRMTYVHTWIENDVQGQLDTLYEANEYADISSYIGGKRVVDAVVSGGWLVDNLQMIILDSIVTCPGDSLYAWVDSTSAPRINDIDTIYWNYGPNAMYQNELVTANVSIANADEIVAALDTLYYGAPGQVVIPLLDHFPNDGADWNVEMVSTIEKPVLKTIHNSNPTCMMQTFNPCSDSVLVCAQLMDGGSTKMLISDSISYQNGNQVQWRLIASNRLGFADTLDVTSHLQLMACPVVNQID